MNAINSKAEERDPVTRANKDFDRAELALRRLAAEGTLSIEQLNLALDAEADARDNVTKAAERERAAKAAKRREDIENRKEETAAAKRARELDQDYQQLTKRYAPLTAAAATYRQELDKIDRLKVAGRLKPGQDDDLRAGALTGYREAVEKIFDDVPVQKILKDGEAPILNLGKTLEEAFKEAGGRSWDQFERDGLQSVRSLARAIGGTSGSLIGTIGSALLGDARGGFGRGKLGRLTDLLSSAVGGSGVDRQLPGGGTIRDAAARGSTSANFAVGMDDVMSLGGRIGGRDGVTGKLLTKLDKVFGGESGDGTFARAAGRAFAGASQGALASGIASAFGIKQSGLGAQLGGALGSFAGPLGGIVGGLLGGTVGGMLKSVKTGSAALSFSGGELGAGAATGNSAAFQAAATGAIGGVVNNLQQIASQLGGFITGNPSVSIGVRHGDYRVDTTGQNRTKVKSGAKDFNDDQAGAIAYATLDALRDGVVSGFSDKVAQALRSSDDLESAVREALKVDEIEGLLGDVGSIARKTFRDFERQAAERQRVAAKYGFDLVALEKLTGEQRKAQLQQAAEQAVGSLKSLVQKIALGDYGGTPIERRQKLLDEAARLEAAADPASGSFDSSAANKLADVYEQLLQVSQDAFGTAGQYGQDLSSIERAAKSIIASTEDRLAREQAEAQKAVKATAAGIDEANDQLAALIATGGKQLGALEAINQQLAGLGAAGLAAFAAGTAAGGGAIPGRDVIGMVQLA